MNGMFPIVAAFLAASIEGTEMIEILLGVGITRGWRSTVLGAATGFVVLVHRRNDLREPTGDLTLKHQS